MTIHASDPFATPDGQRSQIRRFRSRLPAPVTIWTAGDGGSRAGLTVSSMLVADGEPGRVLGLIDDESELYDAILATGRFTIIPLFTGEHLLADRFAGLLPAPGGKFADGDWTPTPYGPVLADGRSWTGAELDTTRAYGWSTLVEAIVAEVRIGTDDGSPLAHFRGRYHELG